MIQYHGENSGSMNSSSEESAVNLICSSLRQRPVWATVATKLLQSEGQQWREANLLTHDIALSIPDLQSENYETFHLLLLAPEDLADPETLPRIQHLHSLTSGYSTVILFLLHNPDGDSATHQPAMQSFMDLHIQLQTHALSLPTIPLTLSPLSDPAALPTALRAFHASLIAARAAYRWPPAVVDAARELLPWCTTSTVSTGTGAAAATAVALGLGHGTGLGLGLGKEKGRWQVGGQGHGHGQGYGHGYGHGYGQAQAQGWGGDSTMSGALSEGAVEGLRERWVSLGELVQGISAGEVIGGAERGGMVSFWQFEFATG